MTARRKTAKRRRPFVRGEPVVRAIRDATLVELAAAGYTALRVEDVATQAGVHKTTIYRHWPTKQELVCAALRSVTVERAVPPNTGSLRGDLLAVGRQMADLLLSNPGRILRHLLLAGEHDPEIRVIAESLRAWFEAQPRPIVEAARVRRELAPGTDGLLLFSTLAGAIQHRLFMEARAVDDPFLVSLVDLILFGARPPSAE